jgi:pheromone shutdown protein TraB
MIQGIFVVVAVVLILRHHIFISGPPITVTWLSWLTAVAEIGTGLVLGYVGLLARRPSAVDLSAPGRR